MRPAYGRKRTTAAAVVLASGAGIRVGGDRNKVYLPLGGRSVVAWSLRTFARPPGIGVLVLVVRPQDGELAGAALLAAGAAPAPTWRSCTAARCARNPS